MTLTDLYQQLFGKNHITDGDVISMSEHGRAGDVSTGRAFKTVQIAPLTSRQATNASLSLYGFAKPGSATSAALWRIMVEDSTGNIFFADGDDYFDNVWDNRNALSYQ